MSVCYDGSDGGGALVLACQVLKIVKRLRRTPLYRQTADPRSGNKLYCKAHSCPHPSCMGGRGSRDPGCEKHGGPPSTQPVIPKKKKKEKEMLAVGTRVTVSGYEALNDSYEALNDSLTSFLFLLPKGR